jgi:hypothetical protein
MNERIRELLLQATTLNGPFIRFKVDQGKFAKLIVRECMKVAVFKDSGTISTAEVAGWMAAGRSTAAKMIKEHFGVEE